jgi:hypothetical protein
VTIVVAGGLLTARTVVITAGRRSVHSSDMHMGALVIFVITQETELANVALINGADDCISGKCRRHAPQRQALGDRCRDETIANC